MSNHHQISDKCALYVCSLGFITASLNPPLLKSWFDGNFSSSCYHQGKSSSEEGEHDREVRYAYLLSGAGEIRIFHKDISSQPENPGFHIQLESALGSEAELEHVIRLSPSTQIRMGETSNYFVIITEERTYFMKSVNGNSNSNIDNFVQSIRNSLGISRQSRAFTASMNLPFSIIDSLIGPSKSRSSISQPRSTLVAVAAASDVHAASKAQPPKSTNPLDSIEGILGDVELRDRFRKFCKFSFAEENILFVDAVEEFEKIPDKDNVAKKKKADEILKEFVKEGSNSEVNISSEQRKALILAITSDTSNGQNIATVFAPSKREIVDLMRRNFFGRFVKNEKDALMREAQRMQLSGCFASLWQTKGIKSYDGINTYIDKAIGDTENFGRFLQCRLVFFQSQIKPLDVAATDFGKELGTKSLKSTNNALRAVFSIFKEQITVVNMFINETNNLMQSLLDLVKTVRSSQSTIMDQNKTIIEQMKRHRTTVEQSLARESETAKTLMTVKQEYATLDSQKATKPQAAKLKPRLEQLEKELKDASATRENAQVGMVQVESEHSDSILNAMDALQSLEFYRLDSQQQLILRAVLAEQTFLNSLNLRLDNIVSTVMDIDTFSDILSASDSISASS